MFRKYTMEDIDFYASLVADPEVMRYIGNGNPRIRSEAVDRLPILINRYEAGEGLGLMLGVSKTEGSPIGHAGLVPQTIEGQYEVELGYWVARRYWGQGLASEAAAAFRDYGFGQLGLERLVSIIQFENVGSIGVAQHIGMTFEREVEFGSKRVALYSMAAFPV